jgi:hypothetical protein
MARERGLLSRILRPLQLESHVARLEEAEQLPRLGGIDLAKGASGPHEAPFRVSRPPLGDQVAPVATLAAPLRVLRIYGPLRQEVGAAAAQDHVDSVAHRQLDELAGDVREADLASRRR